MKTRSSYLYITLAFMIVLIALAAWLFNSATELHDRFSRHSPGLGVAFLVVLFALLAVATLWVSRLVWTSRSPRRDPAQAPEDVIQAAAVQAEQAEGVIRQVGDSAHVRA